jgi:hypothetical protein
MLTSLVQQVLKYVLVLSQKPVVSKWGSVVLAIFQNPGSSRANPLLEGQEI